MNRKQKVADAFAQYAAEQALNEQLHNQPIPKLEHFKNGELVLTLVDKGWVFVGFLTHLPNDYVRLDCAFNINNWHTVEGLGQLALHGLTDDILIFPCAPVVAKPIFIMKIVEDKWF